MLEQAASIKEIAKRGKDPLAGPLKLGVIYTIADRFATLVRMFIHRTHITGLSDRGAWPWRPSRLVRS